MGKYMRKAKTTNDVAVLDMSYGVRTRAKTLALKKQQALKLHASSATPPSSPAGYLQLRSRRLEKKPPPIPSLHHGSPKRQQRRLGGQNNNKLRQQESPSPILKSSSRVDKDNGSGQEKEGGESKEVEENNNSNSKDLGSFGDNVLDIEDRDRLHIHRARHLYLLCYRSTRESTPCNLTRGTEDTRAPGSSTKPSSPAESSHRLQNSMRRCIPTTREMDEFFGPAEEEQLRRFTEKFNFDPVSDKPLPGRYEWEKLDP
ncbi:hypothetical protein SADUNF_Sadunf17G0049700 [Salix dunnii]|uniref:Cyclin-dependent kinase inhibitor domain-containing protein n=1 Tax=Salix dunnii TaxID=1413687 RepID=A0A835J500_9ROSI|nr:hypothetical protein SADUNF_Sadunf17G0049700 [Salix dunnii]